jgi:hypothetical protein
MYWKTFCILLIYSGSAFANIGAITDISGQPGEIIRGGDKLPGTTNSQINSMDVVATGAGTARIRFADDTKVNITEQSRVTIDNYIYDPQQGDNSRLAMRVGLGTVRYASGQIARMNQQRVDIATPTASIAVRGTDFFMTVDEVGKSLVVLVPSCNTSGNCYTGAIDVTTPGGTVTLNQAFTATAVFSAVAPPTPPVTLTITEGGINNNLILSLPREIRTALNRQHRSATIEISNEAASASTTRSSSRNSGEDQNNSQIKIVVTGSEPAMEAYRNSHSGSAHVQFRNGQGGEVTITQEGDPATSSVGSSRSNTIIIRQSR